MVIITIQLNGNYYHLNFFLKMSKTIFEDMFFNFYNVKKLP